MGQPDAYVLRVGVEDPSGPWQAASIVLAVEISASTSKRDKPKAAAYARASIEHDWRYDVATSTLHRYSAPIGNRYGEVVADPIEPRDLAGAVAEYGRSV